MGSDAPQVREKFFMTSQGERLFTVTVGALLAGFTVFLVVGCEVKDTEVNKVPDEVRALASCNEQPNLTIRTYTGTESDPGRYNEDRVQAVERDRYVVEAVSKCRNDVLNYYAGKRAVTEGK